ncbi:MAG: YafY family protein, partial [Clostridiaceae bacterium]|nr:YafY family protein [Clostridiaceae bacterium]
IYRDIDVLSASGVPVYATRGANGGISILEDYTVNRTALSNSEKESILFALQTLQSTKYPEIDLVLEKLGGIFKNTATDWISIDFSPWGTNPNAYNKFTDIKTAIIQSKVIEIDYIDTYNLKSRRKIEPMRLIFKSQAWYLWGVCLEKQDYRTFRISRIKRVEIKDETFDRSKVHVIEECSADTEKEKPYTHVILQFTGEALYRLYDDFDDKWIHDNGDGTYTLEISLPEDEWMYGYILSFGCFVKVIEPEHIWKIIKERSEKITEYYK